MQQISGPEASAAGKKCASDDNESNRASTTTPLLLLPRDVAAKVLTKAGRNQSYILRESCCLKLKDIFVHHSDPKQHETDTIQVVFTHLSVSYQMEEGERRTPPPQHTHNVKQCLSAACVEAAMVIVLFSPQKLSK